MSRISDTNYNLRLTEQNATYTRNAEQTAEKTTRGEKSGEQRNAVFAGEMLGGDTIMDKLLQAREKAWKVVSDAWGVEQETDETIAEIESHKQEMLEQLDEANGHLRENRAAEEALRIEYEVDVESQEYQDLQLLKKEQDFRNGVSMERPTLEEQKRLAEIKQEPLTEYQTRALELNEHAAKFKRDIQTAKDWMKVDDENIQSIQLEKLKSHAMVDATNEADVIMETASKEAVGEMLAEGKEHIDEKLEEAKEKAEENAKKQEEKEEIREEIKLEKAIKQAMIEGTAEAVKEAKAEARRREASDVDTPEMLEMTQMQAGAGQVSQSLAELKANMKVLEADLKGIKVDEEI